MEKVKTLLSSTYRSLLNVFVERYFSLLGLLWICVAFFYVGEPEFWTIVGFGTLFTGVQSIISEIKLK